jgi:ATP-binding cassette, subfamily B, bacterial
MKEKSAYSGAFTKQTIAIYAKSVSKYPWLLLALLITGILMQAMTLAQPLFLREFFNLIAAGDTSPQVVAALSQVLMTIALLMVGNWIFVRLHIASLVYIDGRLMRDLYERAFDYLIGHSYYFFTNQFAGTLTRRVGRFSKSFESIFDAIVMQFLPALVFITGAVIVIGMQNIVLGTLFGAWVILVTIIQIILVRLNNPLRVVRAAEDSKLTGALSDAIGNQNTISLFSGASFEKARLRTVTQSWYRALIRTWNMDEVIWGVLGLLMLIINIAMLYGALHFWQRGMLTVGDFALIQAYLLTTFDRLFAINREIRNFNEAFADAGEMVEILEQPHDVQDAPNAKELTVSSARIEFDKVNFFFSEAQPILPEFSLAVSGGEKIALVGPSGAGKTTVTKLLLRLYDVKGGRITIDGQNIAEVTQDSLREAIAFVPQEPVLFHRTLMDNIRYGRRDATDEEVKEAARQAHCEEFIGRTPLGYLTYVGERGIKLSGGERQRIAIARAILKNAPILVLDEATSSLDSESEALIQDALAKLMEGKTVIAIAHRLSTVMKMDRIVVIENGRVATSGTHDELVAHEGGLYKKLWEIQAGGFLTDD